MTAMAMGAAGLALEGTAGAKDADVMGEGVLFRVLGDEGNEGTQGCKGVCR